VIKVMFDTSVVSYWHSNHKDWAPGIESTLLELSKHRPLFTKVISSVTTQELTCCAELCGGDEPERLTRFLRSNFGEKPLMLNGPVAVRAAQLQAAIGTPPKIYPKSAHETQKHWWFRDAAIMASAIVHEVDYLIVADADFLQWKGLFKGELIRVQSAAGASALQPNKASVPPDSSE
jgi:hypothetical protein